MSNTHRIFFVFAALLIVSSACGALPAPVSNPTSDISAFSTAIAQTVVAELTQKAPQQSDFTPTLEGMPTPESTFTLEPPTATFTETETSTPTQTLTSLPIFTATSSVPLISVSVATNCRVGPGKVYPMVGALLVGKTAEVLGRDPSNNYWYIRNPGAGAEFCWVWGEYATVTGSISLLPVFTPPPTPTATVTPTPSPSFSADYTSLDTCASAWWAKVRLDNTGPVSFKSVNISVHDKATDVTVVSLADGFTNIEGCLKTTKKDVLGTEDAFLLSAPAFSYDPTGHKIEASITLCSETGQKGFCVTNKFTFKP